MILTHCYVAPDGSVTVKSKHVICPLCGLLAIPIFWGADQAYRWLEFEHFPHDVEALADYREILPNCARCQRYATENMTPSDTLHRKCFEPTCGCECSDVPASPTDLTPRFEEAE